MKDNSLEPRVNTLKLLCVYSSYMKDQPVNHCTCYAHGSLLTVSLGLLLHGPVGKVLYFGGDNTPHSLVLWRISWGFCFHITMGVLFKLILLNYTKVIFTEYTRERQ
jgi:hypothetical protein